MDFKKEIQEKIDELTNQYNERTFEYDADTDEAYQDYARMMRASGQKAMEDTVGKAAALTGGYASSNAVTAGQQVYNDYISELAAAQGDFYDRALARYANEGSMLQEKINALETQELKDKSAWETAYAEDIERMAIEGDTAGLAAAMGVSEEAYNKYLEDQALASSVAPTQEILDQATKEYMAKGYFSSGLTADDASTDTYENKIIADITEKFQMMGYNSEAITAHLKQQRAQYEKVANRTWTYVSGAGKNAIFTDQFGNVFYQDEILNWAKDQEETDDVGADVAKKLEKKLKGMY